MLNIKPCSYSRFISFCFKFLIDPVPLSLLTISREERLSYLSSLLMVYLKLTLSFLSPGLLPFSILVFLLVGCSYRLILTRFLLTICFEPKFVYDWDRKLLIFNSLVFYLNFYFIIFVLSSQFLGVK